jgi:hypothetical protein
MSNELGCAQNPDGSLKEAHEIEFVYSPSANSIALPAQLPSVVAPCPDLNKCANERKRACPKWRQEPTSRAEPASKKRSQLTLHDKLKIIEFDEEVKQNGQKLSQTAIAKYFQERGFPKLSQTTVGDILNKREEIRAQLNGDVVNRDHDPGDGNGPGPTVTAPLALGTVRVRVRRYPEVNSILRKWQLQEEGKGRTVTGPVLVAKGQEIAKMLDIKFPGSQGWLQGFKKQHGLREFPNHGEARSVNPEHVTDARSHLQALLKGYKLHDIYNMDETGLFYRMPPDRGLSSKRLAGLKGDKTQITLAFCVNADGSDLRKPLFIGHARKPRCFQKRDGTDLGFSYYWNKKAWMTGTIFQS